MENVMLVYEAAKEMGAELSALSWGGFNLFGDDKSIKELQRLMHAESRMKALQQRLDEMQKMNDTWRGQVDRMSGAFDESEHRRWDEWR
jgi:hypothetical protein